MAGTESRIVSHGGLSGGGSTPATSILAANRTSSRSCGRSSANILVRLPKWSMSGHCPDGSGSISSRACMTFCPASISGSMRSMCLANGTREP
jgi:hypothetical protein